MPDQTVIRTETIAGRTYAVVIAHGYDACDECALYPACSMRCCLGVGIDYPPGAHFIELPHADKGE